MKCTAFSTSRHFSDQWYGLTKRLQLKFYYQDTNVKKLSKVREESDNSKMPISRNWLHFFIAAQTAQVAQSILFKWARQSGCNKEIQS